jgi:hypothetical protein
MNNQTLIELAHRWGMPNRLRVSRKFLPGTLWGRLTVRAYIPSHKVAGKLLRRAQAECVCECGNVVVIDCSSLSSGRTTSCGCGWKHRVQFDGRGKVCGECNTYKPLKNFQKSGSPHAIGNKDSICKECRYLLNISRQYGISPSDYVRLLQRAEDKCEGCGKTKEDNGKNLTVDHNHTTGKVRGILCHSCNSVVGFTDESPKVLRRLASYLEERR